MQDNQQPADPKDDEIARLQALCSEADNAFSKKAEEAAAYRNLIQEMATGAYYIGEELLFEAKSLVAQFPQPPQLFIFLLASALLLSSCSSGKDFWGHNYNGNWKIHSQIDCPKIKP